MSDTTNAYEKPGGNYPDAGVPSGPESTAGTQDAPAQDTHETTPEAQLEGVIAQTRADAATQGFDSLPDVRQLLQRRLGDAGFDVSPDELDALVQRVISVDDATRGEPGAQV